MNKFLNFESPYRLLIIHTLLILVFMILLSDRWFLTDIPYDCFYVPFFIISGPIVYLIAHLIQHFSETFFTTDQVMISWNIVPGTVCLVLGGLQWWLIESLFVNRRKGKILN
jgi:hypothetical protein